MSKLGPGVNCSVPLQVASNTYVPQELGLTLIQLGRCDEALAFIETLPLTNVRTGELALVYHAQGRKTEADAALKELIAKAYDPFQIAEVYAYRGEVDAAFEWLQTDDQKKFAGGPFGSPHWIKRKSPFLKSLHSDVRWSAWAAPRP
jgi:hypothetical protein